MSKKKKIVIVTIIALVLAALTAAAVILGKEAYDKSVYEYKRATHPLMYSEYVEKYADGYGLDKFVLYAVIKTESGFDPNAVSDTGARGLMQLMETSFDWVKMKLGDDDEITYDDMFDPENNIRYGAYLWDYLTEYFGCTDTAAAAYFSGIGEVGRWVSDPAYSADGVHLDTIPSKSAAHYVNKINNALETYIELYGQERKE
ncbi:MAG: lytic transglycosylase domain-containing protein [Ruminiclostridium sp.]|nr:lytic transglycosylase domain-containing protein [Ruminiclostridium sp.]